MAEEVFQTIDYDYYLDKLDYSICCAAKNALLVGDVIPRDNVAYYPIKSIGLIDASGRVLGGPVAFRRELDRKLNEFIVNATKEKNKSKELFSNNYIGFFNDGTIGVSDGVGFVGSLDQKESRQLYAIMKEYFDD